jgi:hypothetical protein
MTLREQLILVSDRFGAARGIGRQRVSTLVLNRGSTLDLLAGGSADVTTGTFERAMLWFSANWPEGAEWPAEVLRPCSVPEAAE